MSCMNVLSSAKLLGGWKGLNENSNELHQTVITHLADANPCFTASFQCQSGKMNPDPGALNISRALGGRQKPWRWYSKTWSFEIVRFELMRPDRTYMVPDLNFNLGIGSPRLKACNSKSWQLDVFARFFAVSCQRLPLSLGRGLMRKPTVVGESLPWSTASDDDTRWPPYRT